VSEIFTVLAEFASKDDADAAIALLGELGFIARLKRRRINTTHKPPHEWRQSKILLRQMLPQKWYTYEDLAIMLEEADYAGASATSLVHILVRAKVLNKSREGRIVYLQINKEHHDHV
jgi:hypothetical protein